MGTIVLFCNVEESFPKMISNEEVAEYILTSHSKTEHHFLNNFYSLAKRRCKYIAKTTKRYTLSNHNFPWHTS
jgi:hypothetical protein